MDCGDERSLMSHSIGPGETRHVHVKLLIKLTPRWVGLDILRKSKSGGTSRSELR